VWDLRAGDEIRWLSFFLFGGGVFCGYVDEWWGFVDKFKGKAEI
jgi:hypothetical protein